MSMSFAYPFLNFLQPGILIPELADLRPMILVGLLALLMYLWRKSELPRLEVLRHPAIKWMAFFLFVQTISVYREGVSSIVYEASIWLVYMVFVLVSIALIGSVDQLRKYVWGVMCGSAFIIFFGIYAVVAGLPNAIGGRAGAYGMYENHNDYTFIIIQTLPFLYMFHRHEQSFVRRMFLRVTMVACVIGVLLSLSRGGILALVLEAALIVMLTMSRRAKIILLPAVLLIGTAAVGYQYAKRAANQGDSYTAEDAESSRMELWRAGRRMVEAHPLLGVGSRRFGETSKDYGEISHDNLGKNAHNTIIDITANTGFLGILAFLKMLHWAWKGFRQRAEGPDGKWIESVRLAGMIALVSLLFRAQFDAKEWDWCFYLLATLGAASATAARVVSARSHAGAADAAAAPATAGDAPAPGLAEGFVPLRYGYKVRGRDVKSGAADA